LRADERGGRLQQGVPRSRSRETRHEMNGNRWLIAAAGVVMQIALGAVYAWSVFRIPLTQAYGWSIGEVTLAFTIAIFVLGFAAFGGGLWMRRAGPRPVGLVGRALYRLGSFFA